MPLWVSDFLGDTLELSGAEIGAYMLLLMAQWNRGGKSLPDDQAKLKRLCRAGRNWPKIWASIEHYFARDKDGFYSKRVRYEYELVVAKRLVKKQSGALGGQAKALKTLQGGLANATFLPLAKPKQKPTNQNHNQKEKENQVKESAPKFDEFWKKWKALKRSSTSDSRKEAEAAWDRLSAEKKKQAFLGVVPFQNNWRKEYGPKISLKHACRYLKHELFEAVTKPTHQGGQEVNLGPG
jgi:uncharacterized protein YdaU (DUF1376 family)